MARPRPAYVAASAVVAAGLLAGCSGASSGTKTPGPWSSGAAQPDGMLRGAMPAAGQNRKVVAGAPWSFTLADKSNPNVPTSQWPSADEVLTQAQLKAAIPEASSVSLGACVKGIAGPTETAKNASCEWSVSLKDAASGYPASVTVTIVAIGADKTNSGVTSEWTSVRNKNFAAKANNDRYFTQGSFGAKGSYYLDNDQASVLVSDGNIAAWIDLDFHGFNSLANSRDTLVQGVFPVLAKDLADRLPRKYS